MKKLPAVFLFLTAVSLLVSCSTLSQAVRDAGISTTTSTRVIAGRALVATWDADYNAAYSASSVAGLAADELAKEGWYDIWVLAEPIEYDFSVSAHIGISVLSNLSVRLDTPDDANTTSLVKWKISIYR